MGDVSIKDWQEKFSDPWFIRTGNKEADRKTACTIGWWDWFCRDESLLLRTKKFLPLIRSLKTTSKVDIDKDYIFFKNNCPVNGPLYDSFSICKMDGGDVKYFIAYKCCWDKDENGKPFTWTVSKLVGESFPGPGKDWPKYHFKSVKDVIKFFNEG